MSESPSATERAAIAVSNKRDVNLPMPWFVRSAKYQPRSGNVIQPLINGQRAFAAVHDAISKATKSIDIISWGFDPSMRLLRPDGERIGSLLERKAGAGVEVRLLVWKTALANVGENNIIGDGLFGSGGGSGGLGSGMESTSEGGAPNDDPDGFNGYGHVRSPSGSAAVRYGDPDAKAFNRDWFAKSVPNLSFRTRGFSSFDRGAIEMRHVAKHGVGGHKQRLALTWVPSHHQKVILVDYELPEQAIGFVMGHNLLRNYWDTDDHAYVSDLREHFPPWQDLSSRVFGPVLHDLNENFCTAWSKAQPWIGSALPISEARLRIKAEDFVLPASKRGTPGMAQICRTQPQENDRSILESYKLALGNARSYVYFENQYFRNTELAMRLREMRRALKSRGWKRDLYVFVVTNVPDDHGRITTYETLEALGKTDRMPNIEKKSDPIESDQEALRRADLEGMNIVICTLCASGVRMSQPVVMQGSGPGPMGLPSFSVSPPMAQTVYQPIYVHSKLLLVDDVFFTLGSANINTRSMEVDSELNIAVPSPEVAQQWRKHLWSLHTKGQAGDVPAREFLLWQRAAQRNGRLRDGSKPLESSLVDFLDEASSGSRAD